MNSARRVMVAGIGGNIGSHLAEHLARMPEIGSLVLIDRDSYEPRNRDNPAGVARGPKQPCKPAGSGSSILGSRWFPRWPTSNNSRSASFGSISWSAASTIAGPGST